MVRTKARAGLTARLASLVDVSLEPRPREATLPVDLRWHSVSQSQLSQHLAAIEADMERQDAEIAMEKHNG